MAIIYAPPLEIPFPEPDYRNYDYDEQVKKEEKWIEELRFFCKKRCKASLVGEIVRVRRGNGYAMYMVCQNKPFAMIYLPMGAAWRGDDIWERGIRLSDAKRILESERALKALFETRKAKTKARKTVKKPAVKKKVK